MTLCNKDLLFCLEFFYAETKIGMIRDKFFFRLNFNNEEKKELRIEILIEIAHTKKSIMKTSEYDFFFM